MAMRMFLAVSTKDLYVEDLERNFSIRNSICHSLPLSEADPPPGEGCPTVKKVSNKDIANIINLLL